LTKQTILLTKQKKSDFESKIVVAKQINLLTKQKRSGFENAIIVTKLKNLATKQIKLLFDKTKNSGYEAKEPVHETKEICRRNKKNLVSRTNTYLVASWDGIIPQGHAGAK